MGTPWTPEEDRLFKKLVPIKTASEIGEILGRSKGAIHGRAATLGISMVKKGENHWKAKLSNLQVQMLVVLHDAGFSINEIHKAAFNHVALQTISDAAAARTRKDC